MLALQQCLVLFGQHTSRCSLGQHDQHLQSKDSHLRAVSIIEGLSQGCDSTLWVRKACRHCTVAKRTFASGCRNSGQSRGMSCSKELAEELLLPKTAVKR